MPKFKNEKIMQQKFKLSILLVWILCFEVISFIIGFTSSPNNGLIKSEFTPPGYVFSIVWPILYVFLAIISYILWQNREDHKRLSELFGAQMILNWSWSPIFFIMQRIDLALFVLLSIIVLNICILYRSFTEKKIVFYLLVPYFIWICVAGYLNFILFWMNCCL